MGDIGKVGQNGHHEHDRAVTVQLLRAAEPDCTFLPGTVQYDEARKGFWAQDQALTTPYCIFQPRTRDDVAEAVKILRQTKCPFAIKSGGHGRCAGESSISAGVLIDLKGLNRISLSEDRSTCKVGPGNSWKDVYSVLNPQGLTAVGGRASNVGVGGFCVSGGISFYSNKYGWALDNVVSFEVVLADGNIVEASQDSYPDLYRALRGGGANFGIVTDLTLNIYPYEGVWGGGKGWKWENGDALIDAFIEYGNNSDENSDVSVILGAINVEGQWVYHADLVYLKPEIPTDHAIIKRFNDIPAIDDRTSVTSQINRTDGIAHHYPPGSHNGFWTFCTRSDKRIIKFFMETWAEEAGQILDVKGFDRSALADCQFVTKHVIDAMSRNGGNALSLSGNEPFILMLIEPYWMDESQSHRVWNALRTTGNRVQAEARRLGLHHEYIYLNYANPFQDVFAGYGPKSKKFLQETSAKYDAEGFFQYQRGAGWHLHGPIVKTDPVV